MKVWLPFTASRSGSTTFIRMLAWWLDRAGLVPVLQEFPHCLQYAPHVLGLIPPPAGAQAVVTNSWNGFAFHRAGLRSICVEHLYVMDPALSPYKSPLQSAFHSAMVRRFVARSYRSADHIVGVSDYTSSIIRDNFPDLPIHTIANGVDTALFHPPSGIKRTDDVFRLLFVGNPTRRKGADLLPDILSCLGSGFELRITAEPSELPYLRGGPQVTFLGRLDKTSLIREYQQADALLAPTRLEGLPLSILEAMACGLPVITTNCTSLPEAVVDGETGFTCAVDDVSALCSAAQSLKSNSAMRISFGTSGRKRAMAQFSLDRMGDAYLSLLSRSL